MIVPKRKIVIDGSQIIERYNKDGGNFITIVKKISAGQEKLKEKVLAELAFNTHCRGKYAMEKLDEKHKFEKLGCEASLQEIEMIKDHLLSKIQLERKGRGAIRVWTPNHFVFHMLFEGYWSAFTTPVLIKKKEKVEKKRFADETDIVPTFYGFGSIIANELLEAESPETNYKRKEPKYGYTDLNCQYLVKSNIDCERLKMKTRLAILEMKDLQEYVNSTSYKPNEFVLETITKSIQYYNEKRFVPLYLIRVWDKIREFPNIRGLRNLIGTKREAKRKAFPEAESILDNLYVNNQEVRNAFLELYISYVQKSDDLDGRYNRLRELMDKIRISRKAKAFFLSTYNPRQGVMFDLAPAPKTNEYVQRKKRFKRFDVSRPYEEINLQKIRRVNIRRYDKQLLLQI